MEHHLGTYTDRLQSERRSRPLYRGIVALARVDSVHAAEFAKSTWPGDRATVETIQKSAVIPTSTTTSGLAVTGVPDLVSIIGPMSAFGAVASRAIQLALDGANSILVPTVTASASGVAFVAQGSPFPVRQYSFDGPTLTAKKLALGAVMTRELFEGSNAPTLVKAKLSEDLSLGVDSLFLDAVASDTVRPAGLRNNVNATAATAGGGQEAMIKDLANLAAAIAPLAVSQSNIIFLAAPGEATKISIRTNGTFAYPVFATAGLASGIVLALATNCLAVAGDAAPRFEISRNAVMHMDDSATAVAQISTVGTPNSVAAPLLSTYQQDAVAVRFIFEMNWALRASGAIAWTQAVTW
ncbi:hypothetical protein GWG65_03495 [Bradyrhizobium sp. CSA207]|uniref:hypothetical protein n=1 Tax=Bradyrhizobium sp. CSA207 TaxID=2698826 RepID=UPI0023B0D127|nr:hypothetical protein [Bradyrhizobium sp. CSA207]MDE5440528.1 hypothetical protein [Bradyrhizobium sp. CSA207]